MLSAAHRMREGSDFSVTMRRGVRSGNSTLVVHLLRPDDPPVPSALVGFVVSKAVGTAVVRNRVKRRLRHLVADRLDRLEPGSRLVVRALPPSATAEGDLLATELDSAWQRAQRRTAARA
ncbi:ribonuclease P protein component [Serinibacter arcticus]|uniref:Ribonuclease P protein component n=1 Tax=Serinibacter arcticus TaxID=1655435 RepID=A0A2U1ZVV6_9MICO|nr:ribonuclease P protein component [Serinibacter arcticus]PWD51127.1 ribonuclease P protein component [Serinibacter arcticus]